MKFVNWMRRVWIGLRASLKFRSQISSAERKANRLLNESERILAKLRRTKRLLKKEQQGADRLMEKWKDRVDKAQRRVASIAESAAEDIEEFTERQNRYDATVDELQNELRVYKDVTIPGLVAANKLTLAELDSWVAVQVRRQVAAQINEGE